MESKQFGAYNTDELLCLYNCVRESHTYIDFDNESVGVFHNFDLDYTEKMRKMIKNELHNKSDYLDDSEPWTLTAAPDDMSARAISETTTDILRCFVTCITIALKYLDNEDQFDTRVGVTMKFARSLRKAISDDLAKRPEDSRSKSR